MVDQTLFVNACAITDWWKIIGELGWKFHRVRNQNQSRLWAKPWVKLRYQS